MRHRRFRTGRAQRALAEVEFERALLGKTESDRKPFDPLSDRKTMQLCRQVEHALSLALAGECGDDVLRDVYLASVDPIGAASQLLVRVVVPVASGHSAMDVLKRLNDRSPKLRALVGQAISRKRVPGLSFVAVPDRAPAPQGGES